MNTYEDGYEIVKKYSKTSTTNQDSKLSVEQRRIGRYIFQNDRFDHVPVERNKTAKLVSIKQLEVGDEVLVHNGSWWQHRLVLRVNVAAQQYTAMEFVPDCRRSGNADDQERATSNDVDLKSALANSNLMRVDEINAHLKNFEKIRHAKNQADAKRRKSEGDVDVKPNDILDRCGIMHFRASMNIVPPKETPTDAKRLQSAKVNSPTFGIIQVKIKKFSNNLYKFKYDKSFELSVAETLENAYRLLRSVTYEKDGTVMQKEMHYDVFKNNNEHFTTWCKCGTAFSAGSSYFQQWLTEEEVKGMYYNYSTNTESTDLGTTIRERIEKSFLNFQYMTQIRFSELARQFRKIHFTFLELGDAMKPPERHGAVIKNFDADDDDLVKPQNALSVTAGDRVVLLNAEHTEGHHWTLVRRADGQEGYVPTSVMVDLSES